MSEDQPDSRKHGHRKLLALGVVAMMAVVYFGIRDYLDLQYLAARESDLKAWQAQYPRLVFVIAGLIYVAITGLSLPGATVLTLLYSWYFGFFPSLFLVSFASTAGATLAFLLSRYLFRDAVQARFGERLASFNAAWAREGPLFLLTLRLVPAFPFFVINAVMGLTPIATRTFWWVSQIGMLPGTAVYVYAGSRVPGLQDLAERGVNAVLTPRQVTEIAIALLLLGSFPLVIRALLARFGGAKTGPGESGS